MICFGVHLQSHQIDDKIIRLMTQSAFVLFFDSYKFDLFMPEIDKNHWFFIAKVPGQLFYKTAIPLFKNFLAKIGVQNRPLDYERVTFCPPEPAR